MHQNNDDYNDESFGYSENTILHGFVRFMLEMPKSICYITRTHRNKC